MHSLQYSYHATEKDILFLSFIYIHTYYIIKLYHIHGDVDNKTVSPNLLSLIKLLMSTVYHASPKLFRLAIFRERAFSAALP